MKKILLVLISVSLSSCSSTPDVLVTPAEKAVEQKKSEACKEHPELADQWGECNVQKKVKEKIPAIKACFDKTLEKDITLSGDLMLKIKLWKSGKVRIVFVTEGSLKNKLIGSCIIAEIRKITFAKPPEGLSPVIYFPFSLDSLK